MLTGGSIARAVDITAAVLEDPGSVSAQHSAAASAALSSGATWTAGSSWGGDAQTAAIIVLCDLTSPAALLPSGTDTPLASLSAQYAASMGQLTQALLRSKVLTRIAGVLHVWLKQALQSIHRFGVEVGGSEWTDPAHVSTLCAVNLCISIASVTATHTAKFRSHLVQESNFIGAVVVPYAQVLAAWLQWAHERTAAAAQDSSAGDVEDAAVVAEAAEVLAEGLQAMGQTLRLLVWCSFRTKSVRASIRDSPCLGALMQNTAVHASPSVLALACKLAVNCDALKGIGGDVSSAGAKALLLPVQQCVEAMGPHDKASLGRRVQVPSAEAPVLFGGNDTFHAFRFLFELPTEVGAAKAMGRAAGVTAHVAALPSVNGPGTLSPLKSAAVDSESDDDVPARSLVALSDADEAYRQQVAAADPDAFPEEDTAVPGLTATSIFQQFGNAAPAAGLSAIPLMPEPESDSDQGSDQPATCTVQEGKAPHSPSPAAAGSGSDSDDAAGFGAAPTSVHVAAAPALAVPPRPVSRALQRTAHSAAPLSPVRSRGTASGLGALPALPAAGVSLVGGGGGGGGAAAGTQPQASKAAAAAARREKRERRERRHARKRRAAPPQHLCAITGQPLEDPVRLYAEGSGGRVYERSALLEQLQAQGGGTPAGAIVVAEDIAQQLQQEQLARLLAR